MKSLNSLNMEYMKKLNQLNSDNKEAFMIVSNYVKYDFKKSESVSMDLLNDILDHLLEAQSNGVKTNEFFGDDLQGYANELVKELPNNKVNRWKWFYIFFTTLTIGSLALPFGIIDYIKLLITGSPLRLPLYSILIVLLVFILVQILLIKFTIEKSRLSDLNSTKTKIIFIGCFLIMLFIPIFLTTTFPVGQIIDVNHWMFILVGLTSILVSIWIYINKVKDGGH